MKEKIKIIEISEEHKRDMDNMTDKQLVQVWKVYSAKAKNTSKNSKDYNTNFAIADYAFKLHNQNLFNKNKKKN